MRIDIAFEVSERWEALETTGERCNRILGEIKPAWTTAIEGSCGKKAVHTFRTLVMKLKNCEEHHQELQAQDQDGRWRTK